MLSTNEPLLRLVFFLRQNEPAFGAGGYCVMNTSFRSNRRTYLARSFLALLILVLLYNRDSATGQRKFEALCKEEGGYRVYERLEKNVGWIVDEPIAGQITDLYHRPFSFGPVAFVRTADKSGNWFDAMRDPDRPGKFILAPADQTRPVRYRFKFVRQVFPDDERFQRNQELITDLANGKPAASLTFFYFEWTKPENVILHAPTSQRCKLRPDIYARFARALFAGPDASTD